MDCQEFDFIVIDLARATLIEAPLRESGLMHAASCEQCRGRLADECALASGLRALSAATDGISAPQRLEATLLAQFRQQSGAGAESNVVPFSPKRNWAKYWIAAAAAAVIIAALTVAASQLLKSPSEQRVVTLTPGPSVSPTQAVAGSVPQIGTDKRVAADIKEPDDKVFNKPRKKRPTRPSAQDHSSVVASVGEFTPILTSQDARPEVTTDFFPLTHEQASPPLESGQLIRVQMPRSALASFGLPINVEQANVPVKADVLLAEDGSARAIRFVR